MTDVLFGPGYQVKIRTGEVAGLVPTATRVFLGDLIKSVKCSVS